MEKKKDNKKIYMISGIIVLIIAVIIGIIIMNLNNDEKYIEVSKRVLPQMKDFLVETVEYSVDLKKEALSIFGKINTWLQKLPPYNKILPIPVKTLEDVLNENYVYDLKNIINHITFIFGEYKKDKKPVLINLVKLLYKKT